MSDRPTEEEIRASIVPKSDQLNSEDLLTGPITVTVKGVRRGTTKEQPINVELVETERAFRPCKTMRRILIAAWSDDSAKWIGQRITLFCDPSVVYAGVRVGGVRISHLSGLDGPKTFLLTQTRGKKAEVIVKPLPVERLPKFRAWLKTKGLSEQDATAAIDGTALETATDEQWNILRQWAKETERVLTENERQEQ